MNINVQSIRLDGNTQSRVGLHEETVADYADVIRGGGKLPPVVVFHDGSDRWLADGFHRLHAYRAAGKASIPADVRSGTQRDALLHSAGANVEHGLRRTNADKRRSVEILLGDAEWATWTDNEIAKRCGLSHPFVGSVRRSLETVSSEKPAERVYSTKHGTPATMDVSRIGKALPAPPPPAAAPEPEDDAPTLEQIVDELQRENEQMALQIEALTKDDTKAELARQIAIRQGIETRLSDSMEHCKQLDKLNAGFGKWYAELRKLTGLQERHEITRFVREAVNAKEAAL